jgi:hypothetical protein
MIFELIDPSDLFLISIEIIISLGLLVALIISLMVRKKFLILANQGWNIVCLGIVCLLLHAIFDAIDTINLADVLIDILNLFDGLFFLLGIIILGFGIFKIANFSAEQWRS